MVSATLCEAQLMFYNTNLFKNLFTQAICACVGYLRWCPSNWWTVTRLTTRRRSFSERTQFEKLYDSHFHPVTLESTSDVTSLAAPRVMGAAGCAPRCQRTGGWSRTVYPGVMDTS